MDVTLPAAEAGKVLDWARQSSDLAGRRPVQWSDCWRRRTSPTRRRQPSDASTTKNTLEPGDVVVTAFPART
jgi:hypothetical protein